MDLTIYDIIQRPTISDKAYKLHKKLQKLVLRVHPKANKPLIKKAVEKLFDVKVESVGIIIRKGKTRKVQRRIVRRPLTKKAIITLKEGYALDLFDQAGKHIIKEKESAA